MALLAISAEIRVCRDNISSVFRGRIARLSFLTRREAAAILTEKLGFQVNQPTVTRHAREKGLGRVVGRIRLLTQKDLDKLAGWVREEPCWAGDDETRKKMSRSARKRWARERQEDDAS